MSTVRQRYRQTYLLPKVSKILVGIAFMLGGNNASATEGQTVLSAKNMASVTVARSEPKQDLTAQKDVLPSGFDVPKGLGLSFSQRWEIDKSAPLRYSRGFQNPALPFAYTRISSDFGIRKDPLLGTWRTHQGIDLPGAVGTPIYAANDGWVTHSGYSSGYGLLVRIDHGERLESFYGHLSGVAVNNNSQILRGTLIGYLGSTGRSTGAHLHFEVRQFGRAVDPLTYLTAREYRNQTKPSPVVPQPVHISEYAKRRLTQQPAQEGLPGSF